MKMDNVSKNVFEKLKHGDSLAKFKRFLIKWFAEPNLSFVNIEKLRRESFCLLFKKLER